MKELINWQLFEDISVVITYLTFIASLVAAFKAYQYAKRLKEASKIIPNHDSWNDKQSFHKKVNSILPYVVGLSLIPESTSIEVDVKSYLKKEYPRHKFEFEFFNMDGIDNEEHKEKFNNELIGIRKRLDVAGATEVHVFYQGPVAGAALLGSIFRNWKVVKIYQRNRLSGYEFWFVLN